MARLSKMAFSMIHSSEITDFLKATMIVSKKKWKSSQLKSNLTKESFWQKSKPYNYSHITLLKWNWSRIKFLKTDLPQPIDVETWLICAQDLIYPLLIELKASKLLRIPQLIGSAINKTMIYRESMPYHSPNSLS